MSMPIDEEIEKARYAELVRINGEASDRATLEARYGQVWSTDELSREYEVVGFLAPYAVVKRRSDGVMGSVAFQHHPRFYFAFQEDKE